MTEKELVVVENTTTAPLLQQADIEGTVAFFNNYQELTQQLLNTQDYQKLGKKQFKKKSAWRKYATAFSITDRVVEKEIIRDTNHRIISARYEVEASAPNGRKAIGVGVCSIYDKLKSSDTQEPSSFELRKRFSHAEHDIVATAHTRAKSRAIADIIGTGEVSAEEMEEIDENEGDNNTKKGRRKFTSSKPKTKPSPKPAEEVIETKAEVVGDKPTTKSLKELSDENKTIKKIITTLQQTNEPITKESVKNNLVQSYKDEKISLGEYRKAKELLE